MYAEPVGRRVDRAAERTHRFAEVLIVLAEPECTLGMLTYSLQRHKDVLMHQYEASFF